MKEFKGTPGPWQVAGPCCDAVGVEFDSTGYKAICHRPERTGGKMTDEYNANMQLIAAAPELLEALQNLISGYEDMAEVGMFDMLCHGDEIEAANAAIKKALGEKQ